MTDYSPWSELRGSEYRRYLWLLNSLIWSRNVMLYHYVILHVVGCDCFRSFNSSFRRVLKAYWLRHDAHLENHVRNFGWVLKVLIHCRTNYWCVKIFRPWWYICYNWVLAAFLASLKQNLSWRNLVQITSNLCEELLKSFEGGQGTFFPLLF